MLRAKSIAFGWNFVQLIRRCDRRDSIYGDGVNVAARLKVWRAEDYIRLFEQIENKLP
jgi:hypothetical protein